MWKKFSQRVLIGLVMLVTASFVIFLIVMELPEGNFLTRKLQDLQARGDRSGDIRVAEYAERYGLSMEMMDTENLAANSLSALPSGHAAEGLLATTAFRTDRIIIKRGQIALSVEDVDHTADVITQLALDYGGYVVNYRAWSTEYGEQTYRHATLQIAVRAEEFEAVMRHLRSLAVKIVDESASGQDVTGEYVDLESRLRNLEMTRDRTRTFLEKAQNAEEALMVNETLMQIEEEVEVIKGRLQYLSQRSMFSTIDVALDQVAGPPLYEPAGPWQPIETLAAALNTLGQILRFLGDTVIWLVTVGLPLAVLTAGGVWIVRQWRKRKK